MLLLSVALLLW